MNPRSGRRVAIVSAVAFLASLAFPVVAGLSNDTASFPKWWGTLDVGLATVPAVLAFVVLGLTQGKVTKHAEDLSCRAYRILIHGIFVMMLVLSSLGITSSGAIV